MANKIFHVLQCIFIFSLIACSKDDEKNSYIFKTIDLVTNEPLENVKIRLGIEIGCSKLLDSKEVLTTRNGYAEVDLKVNQDTIDAYYQFFPNGQSYLNNSIDIRKEGYGISHLKQDTSMAYTFRPIFAEKKIITTYMYRLVPFKIDFINSKNSLSDKFLNIQINCYPRHVLLDPKVAEYLGKFLLETDPKNFEYQGNLADMAYDIEVIITDPVEERDVFKQTFPLNIDAKNILNNTIQIHY
jgi:hypothetical protein